MMSDGNIPPSINGENVGDEFWMIDKILLSINFCK